LLSTHRQCDGDGLGAELAIFLALKKIKKDVRIINCDPTPRKYRFLNPEKYITYFSEQPNVDVSCDLCLIFDTNDKRLLGDLYFEIQKKCANILFVDHHPLLKNGPQPTSQSLIDVSAASTGELVYNLIKGLNIEIDAMIARALYTSITFDTQLYRFVRSSPKSHQIAAELLTHPIHAEEIHRGLFGNQTIQKISFLSQALGEIEYFAKNTIAVLKFHKQDLLKFNLEMDESRDVIDMIMNIESIEAAVIFREDDAEEYKVSLRSKDKIEVLSTAEAIGGGGHRHASGAYVQGKYSDLKSFIVEDLNKKLNASKV